MTNEAAELWEEYDNVAYFVGAAYASPQEEARMAELKVEILAAERRATVERANSWLNARSGIRMTPEEHADWWRFLRENGYEPRTILDAAAER